MPRINTGEALKPFRVLDLSRVRAPVHLTRTPGCIKTAACECGEHTDEILRETGVKDDEIKRLHEQGVV